MAYECTECGFVYASKAEARNHVGHHMKVVRPEAKERLIREVDKEPGSVRKALNETDEPDQSNLADF